MTPDTDAQSQYQGSILYVDAFDSFSNNIVALLETTLNVRVTIIAANAAVADLSRALRCFDAVVLGPGPGDPRTSNDIGLFKRILEVEDNDLTPVLGICLGFQSICLAFGATLERLTNPKHGTVTEIYHTPDSIFASNDSFPATQYHSLGVKIGHPIEIARLILHPIMLWDFSLLYGPTKTCPALAPLAWDVGDDSNGGVLMAVEHAVKPFWGIQFHPESIIASDQAPVIIKRWWAEALKHNREFKKHTANEGIANDTLDGTSIHGLPRRLSLLRRMTHWNTLPPDNTAPPPLERLRGPYEVNTVKLDVGEMTAIDFCESLRLLGYNFIFLDSAISRPEVGCYSIIGIIEAKRTELLEYTSGQSIVNITRAQEKSHSTRHLFSHYLKPGQTIWDFLASYMEGRKAVRGRAASPFWGGLMGYLSYESGMVPDQCTEGCVGRGRKKSPDTVFAYIEQSLVFDNVKKCAYIQSLKVKPGKWIKEMVETLRLNVQEHQVCKEQQARSDEFARLVEDLKREVPDYVPAQVDEAEREKRGQDSLRRFLEPAIIHRPKEKEYRKRVRRCLEYIRAGDSYELCLTDQAQVLIPKRPVDFAWKLYKSLRAKNPAPFAAYLHLSDTAIISSSPERFLSWDREGTCQMRPIKGTVKKGPDMTKHLATDILQQEKEQSENLMIVDLIRHDLHGVVGAGNVTVKKLMVVEEYETVYQLVSIIEGRLQGVKPHVHQPYPVSRPQQAATAAAAATPTTTTSGPTNTTSPPPFDGYTGLDVLQAALPPGSMTGAPKLSSCAILHKLEGHKPRGVYSGVLGYMCAGGGGDFSVLIRCAYRDDNEIVTTKVSPEEPVDGEEDREIEHEVWRIGAGGAITALSDDRAEWEEMNVKLEATLAAFVVEEELESEWGSESEWETDTDTDVGKAHSPSA